MTGWPAVRFVDVLRYQQQFTFIDPGKINRSFRFVNLSDEVATGDFDQVLARITREVQAWGAALVFVDSFRAVTLEPAQQPGGVTSQQLFIQQLGVHLSSAQATTFLVGEYLSGNDDNPVFTVADGLLALEQSVYRNSMVRKIQVV